MRLAAVPLLALLFTLTACGQLDPPAQRLVEAPQRTKAADTARMALESTTDMGDPNGSSMNYTITGDGRIDFAAEQLQLTFDMPGPMPGDMEMVVDGDAAYVNVPSPSSATRRSVGNRPTATPSTSPPTRSPRSAENRPRSCPRWRWPWKPGWTPRGGSGGCPRLSTSPR